MLSLLPSNDQEISKLAEMYDCFAPIGSIKQGELKNAALAKTLDVESICVDNVKCYLVFFSRTLDNYLYVNAVQSFYEKTDINILFQGLDLIMQQHGMSGIKCSTVRSGMAAKCIDYGYKVSAVFLTK